MAFLTPLLSGPAPCLLRNERAEQVLASQIELAGDSKTRRRGLLGRDRLEPGHALVIAPCGSVHTFFMRFSIDVLFITRKGRVVKCAHEVRPWRIALALTAYAAIELPAGTLRRTGTRRGDQLLLTPGVQPSTG